jgi:hypothetical protein
MIIAVPSKGRAGKVISTQVRLPNCVVYVPELEVEAYEDSGNKNVVAVPNDVLGITKTRNWILKNNKDPWIVFIDDDLKNAGYVELQPHKGKHRKLDEVQFLGEFRKLFELTEDLNYRIWGISMESSLRAVYPYRPFLFQTYVTASCMGIINDGRTYFNEDYPVKEDYELCLRCIVEDGGVVGARYLYWENDHWHKEGGCKDYRTQKMESRITDKLMRQYPGFVRRAKDRKGQFCITLNF